MTAKALAFRAIRQAVATIPGDVSNDAVGIMVAKEDEIFAPAAHAAALDPATPIVIGSRGTGKSFWSSVLGKPDTRAAAAVAYPKLGLRDLGVAFGFTGIGGEQGVSVEALDSLVPLRGDNSDGKAFWWATVLRGIQIASGLQPAKLSELVPIGQNWEEREDHLQQHEKRLQAEKKSVLIIFDALDTVATSWLRRRQLTESLLEVVWAMRAYRGIRVKLFLRPDQLDDEALRFVELPKLRTGAVRLQWTGADLYGLLFSRLASTPDSEAKSAFVSLLKANGIDVPTKEAILSRQWSLVSNQEHQQKIMARFAGLYMASGTNGFKKGKTYDWPLKHLSDAFAEVTPRSFLGLMIAAAGTGSPPEDRVVTPEAIRHGLRAASRTRVDQLHQEFPWIKGVLAPLAGLLLPLGEAEVFRAWKRAKTVSEVKADATANKYLPPFVPGSEGTERDLFEALQRIGVMFRRKDNRLDMPDLFRVAAKLLKKGGTAPLR